MQLYTKVIFPKKTECSGDSTVADPSKNKYEYCQKSNQHLKYTATVATMAATAIIYICKRQQDYKLTNQYHRHTGWGRLHNERSAAGLLKWRFLGDHRHTFVEIYKKI